MADSASGNGSKPLASHQGQKLDARVEAWGILGLMFGGIGGCYLVEYFWARDIASLGFGIGAGLGSSVGFVTGAFVHRQPIPMRRLAAFLCVFPGTGVVLAIIGTRWSTVGILAIVVWLAVVYAAFWWVRRWTAARSTTDDEAAGDRDS